MRFSGERAYKRAKKVPVGRGAGAGRKRAALNQACKLPGAIRAVQSTNPFQAQGQVSLLRISPACRMDVAPLFPAGPRLRRDRRSGTRHTYVVQSSMLSIPRTSLDLFAELDCSQMSSGSCRATEMTAAEASTCRVCESSLVHGEPGALAQLTMLELQVTANCMSTPALRPTC